MRNIFNRGGHPPLASISIKLLGNVHSALPMIIALHRRIHRNRISHRHKKSRNRLGVCPLLKLEALVRDPKRLQRFCPATSPKPVI